MWFELQLGCLVFYGSDREKEVTRTSVLENSHSTYALESNKCKCKTDAREDRIFLGLQRNIYLYEKLKIASFQIIH